MKQYTDLRIENGSLVIDAGKQPILTDERASVGQDVKHLVMESGLATQLLGQRSAALKNDIYTAMELLVETDVRIVPGTIEVNDLGDGVVTITATTFEFGDISTQVNYD
jgi:hypothetical protein